MSSPEITLGCVANLWVRQMHFVKAGDCEQPHTHCHDHLTLLTKGKVRVTVNDKTSEFTAPQMIYVQAEQLHTITALEDDTIAHCIHALRGGDRVEDILDPSMIPEGIDPFASVAKSLVKPNAGWNQTFQDQ